MEFYYDFLLPVNLEVIQYCKELPQGAIGKNVMFVDEEHPIDVLSKSIVLLSIPEDRNTNNNEGTGQKSEEWRKEFYKLYYGNWNTKIYDIGELKVGETFNDTLVIVQEIVKYLLKNDFIPIIIGGTQALTYAIYRAYDQLEQRVNITNIDAKFDLGNINEALNSNSYLTRIIMDKPNNLENYTNIGFQTFLNAQEEIHLMDGLLFDTYRLGNVKKDIELAEAALRNSDMMSVDIGVVRSSDAPANFNKIISGFTNDEICQICRYAGISDKLNVLGIFEFNPFLDQDNRTNQLIAQMIWYFVEGVNIRKPEFPNKDLKGFKKYIVMIDDEDYNFYKSEESDRWWMEIHVEEDNKIKRRTLIPCTHGDFLTANRNEIPERWYLNRRKLD